MEDYYEFVLKNAQKFLAKQGPEGESLGWVQDIYPGECAKYPTVNACALLSYMVGRAVVADESLDIVQDALPVIKYVRETMKDPEPKPKSKKKKTA